MIFIFGHTNQFSLHPDSKRILGPAPKCLRRNCNGVCRLYNMERYCHMYWIPIFPDGNKREIVKCLSCQTLYDREEYCGFQRRKNQFIQQVLQVRVAANNATAKRNQEIEEMLHKGQFQQAETHIRKLLEQVPSSLELLVYLEQALNGQNLILPDNVVYLEQALNGQDLKGNEKRVQEESNKVVRSIFLQWQSHYRKDWIAKGRPAAGSSFTRVTTTSNQYRVEAKQFYEPAEYYYKVLALPRDDQKSELPRRLFKLETCGNGSVLKEFFQDAASSKEVAKYDTPLPDVRLVAKDAVLFLNTFGSYVAPSTSCGSVEKDTATALPEIV